MKHIVLIPMSWLFVIDSTTGTFITVTKVLEQIQIPHQIKCPMITGIMCSICIGYLHELLFRPCMNHGNCNISYDLVSMGMGICMSTLYLYYQYLEDDNFSMYSKKVGKFLRLKIKKM